MKSEPSCAGGGNGKWCRHRGRQSDNGRISTWGTTRPSESTLKYIFKGIESRSQICTQVFTSRITHPNQKAEGAQVPTVGWTHMAWPVHKLGHYSTFPRKDNLTPATMWRRGHKPDMKGQILSEVRGGPWRSPIPREKVDGVGGRGLGEQVGVSASWGHSFRLGRWKVLE